MSSSRNSRTAPAEGLAANAPANGQDRYHSAHFQEGFRLLLEARHYADEAGCDEWQFALERSTLMRAGLSLNDLRWLLWNSLIAHATETTDPAEELRRFQTAGRQSILKRSCFVLTSQGVEIASEALGREPLERNGAPKGTGAERGPSSIIRVFPKWDCDLRELRFSGSVVKQFRVPSPNQEKVITAFEEEGWPRRIDDPLPLEPNIDPKQRLHDTIRSLNRNQRTQLVRFMGDGTGEGVLWEPCDENGTEQGPAAN